MENLDYYNDRKYCLSCEDYVPYLMSLEASFCVQCGGETQLFSAADFAEFNKALKPQKPKGGRPRKTGERESA